MEDTYNISLSLNTGGLFGHPVCGDSACVCVCVCVWWACSVLWSWMVNDSPHSATGLSPYKNHFNADLLNNNKQKRAKRRPRFGVDNRFWIQISSRSLKTSNFRAMFGVRFHLHHLLHESTHACIVFMIYHLKALTKDGSDTVKIPAASCKNVPFPVSHISYCQWTFNLCTARKRGIYGFLYFTFLDIKQPLSHRTLHNQATIIRTLGTRANTFKHWLNLTAIRTYICTLLFPVQPECVFSLEWRVKNLKLKCVNPRTLYRQSSCIQRRCSTHYCIKSCYNTVRRCALGAVYDPNILRVKWELAADTLLTTALRHNSGVGVGGVEGSQVSSSETNLRRSFQEQSMAEISPWLEGSPGFVKQTNPLTAIFPVYTDADLQCKWSWSVDTAGRMRQFSDNNKGKALASRCLIHS